jgi:hypothetical protein
MVRPLKLIVELRPRQLLADIAMKCSGGAVSGKCGATIETNNTEGREWRRLPVSRSQAWAAAATCRLYQV